MERSKTSYLDDVRRMVRPRSYRSDFLFALIPVLILCSCTPSSKSTRFSRSNERTGSAVAARKSIPSGWADITKKGKNAELLLWLVNEDLSATITMREMTMPENARRHLRSEDLCTAGNISMQLKLAQQKKNSRITRTPYTLANGKNLCSYVYSENSLLRRVIIVPKNNKFYELELTQEQSTVSFDVLTEDEIQIAEAVMES